MHEFGMIEQLVHQVAGVCAERHIGQAHVLKVRRGPGLVEEALRQAFKVQCAGTVLERARLELEEKPVVIHCECGVQVAIDTTDHHVPYVMCQNCQKVHPVSGLDLLEVIDVG
jgi:Zn finger protein HypA/HybF involved in hydrogenase expression